MRCFYARTLAPAAVILGMAASQAFAGGPRPWLCSDMAVFSSKQPMVYEARTAGGTWVLSFMHFQMGGPNEGHTIVAQRELRSGDSVTGSLPAGRYFAVALHRKSARYWPCPQYVQEKDREKPGVITSLCFSERRGACPARVVVKPADPAAPHPAP